MGAARLCVGLQAILVMSLLLPPPFLPCVLAGGGPGGELVAGEEKHQGRVPAVNTILLSLPDAATMDKGQAVDLRVPKNRLELSRARC
uniref:Uncharacterized protein n=1 Tax=Oryza punctata TaxID=4537 RepID=A0A0E0JX98_ORYPU